MRAALMTHRIERRRPRGVPGTVHPKTEFLRREYVENGRSYADIAREMGLSKERVRQLVSKCGFSSRGQLRRTFTNDQTESIKQRYTAGEGVVTIARDLKTSLPMVYRELGRIGIPVRRNLKRKYDDILKPEFLQREYVDNGRSTIDIGASLGIGSNIVNKYLRDNGIPLRRRTPAQARPLP